jgi:hypothetical protein
MAPRTRRSHTKNPVESAQGEENQSPVPLQTSTLANTKTRSKVAARRVVPEAQSRDLQPSESRIACGQT